MVARKVRNLTSTHSIRNRDTYMALNPNIALAGNVPQVSLANALMNGISAGEAIRNAPILAQLNRMKIPQAQQQMAQQSQNMAINQQNMEIARAQEARAAQTANMEQQQMEAQAVLPYLKYALNETDLDKREQILMQAQDFFEGIGITDFNHTDFMSTDALQSAVMQASSVASMTPGGASPAQFGSSILGEDSEGNRYTITQKRNPDTGTVEAVYAPLTAGAPESPVGPVDIINPTTGQTARQRVETEQEVAVNEARITRNVARADKALTEMENIYQNTIPLYDEALKYLDEGAETGLLESFFPSFKAATRNLERVQNQLGLDVISSVTFGALSEGELNLALSTGLDLSLQEDALRADIIRRRDAKLKLANYLEDAATYFSNNPTAGLEDWAQYAKRYYSVTTGGDAVDYTQATDEELLIF